MMTHCWLVQRQSLTVSREALGPLPGRSGYAFVDQLALPALDLSSRFPLANEGYGKH